LRNFSYLFKLKKKDKDWNKIIGNDNSIYLNRLSPGKYDLTIGKWGGKKPGIIVLKTFTIIIKHPWYSTLLAKILYFLILSGLVYWGFTFFNQKHKLKIAGIEKEKTIEQTKMKIDFFTNIAHEFKTPLSLIIAPLSRLIQEKKNKSDRDTLDLIYQNAIKLNSLVQQAIEYYRDDNDAPVGLVISRVDMVDFAKTIFYSYEKNMKDKELEFIFNSNTEVLYVDLDVVKIESVLNNLLSNACKFTNSGDTIILSVNYDSNNETLKIKVSDSGIGIPEKDLPYIFQRFFKSPSNLNREGTGVGLYLVKRFTEIHGGSVQVESDKNEGTTITITLPNITNKNIGYSEPVENINSEISNKPIMLIVEDNVAIAKFIHDLFNNQFRCLVAYNGKAGYKICMDLKPDIIISDIMMPVMDGLEMCQKIKENIQFSTIPIIMLTAKDDKETELQSIKQKVDAFISKPFDSNILISRVKQLIEIKKQLDVKIRIDNLSNMDISCEVSDDERFLTKITNIIEDNISDPDLNVTYLCKKVNISQKQLYRKIKSLTGLTAVEYIKSVRLKKAALLLSNKNFTIAEVMYKVGFSNHSYFAKCFQSEFGKTPGQYANLK
jgi:signal transduction histidine kinase/DNA-binding response OmpR family regulator